jgi:hypothetical protein
MEVDGGKEAFERVFGKPGEPVPAVDFADMKAILAFREDVKKRNPHPERGLIIGAGAYRSVCSPGADIRAIGYRLSMLELLGHYIEPFPGGLWSDAALKAAARIEMTWLPGPGVTHKGMPFDVMGFLTRVQAEAA